MNIVGMSEKLIVPNVYGIETEYSTLLTFAEDKVYELVGSHAEEAIMGLYTVPETKGAERINKSVMKAALEEMGIFKNISHMLSTGGRFYIDPSGLEYDTPETTTAEEAVERSFDGDEIVFGLLSILKNAGEIKDFQLNRKIVDHNRSSRGVHLNTTTSLPGDEIPSNQVINALSTLNVVKGSIFGSGGLLIDDKGQTAFHHSPRLSLTDALHAPYSTYKVRPLVRHSFKKDGKYLSRVETVTSDALNFGWPLKASLIATNALIRLLEHKLDVRLPVLKEPVSSAKTVGRYGFEEVIGVTGINGRYSKERPNKILAAICELIIEVDQKQDILDAEARQVLPEIIEVSERVDNDPQLAATQVESIARSLAIQKKMDQKGVTLDSDTICRFDYVWDWVGGGVAERLRQKNLAGWQGFKTGYSKEEAAKRRNLPPLDTRAKIRGDLIKSSKGEIEIDWDGNIERYLSPLEVV
jgi:hypothetical protein